MIFSVCQLQTLKNPSKIRVFSISHLNPQSKKSIRKKNFICVQAKNPLVFDGVIAQKPKGVIKVNKEKLRDYNLTGSIHTLEVKSSGEVKDIMEEVSNCITTTTSNGKRGQISKSIINPNKLVGDVFSYNEFETVFQTILAGAGIGDYTIARADLRLDSYDEKHYRDYAKLNRYLISALAVSYKVKNTYRTTNLFSQKQLSVAIKERRFECENYDKKAEQLEKNGNDPTTSRLELRSKDGIEDLEKEFIGTWFKRWDKALKNLDEVQKRYNDELEKIYREDKNVYPKKFLSLREFLMQYQDCIFSKKQMVDLLTRLGECKNPVGYAENYKKRYGIEYFSQKDVEYAIGEVKRAVMEFFNT